MIVQRLGIVVAVVGSWACTEQQRARVDTSSAVVAASTQTTRVETASSSTVAKPVADSDDVPAGPPCSAVDPSVASVSPERRNDIRVALVDSAWAGEPGDIGILLFRVEVRTPERIDTIPTIRVATLPGVSEAGKVHLIAFKSESNIPDDAEVFDPVARTLTICDLPGDVEFDSQHPTISPDARHVAYIGWDNAKAANLGVVKKWSDASVVVKTPLEPWYHDDVDYNGVHWRDTNHVEFAYRSGRARTWIHAVVSIDDRRVIVDSLSAQPVWAR